MADHKGRPGSWYDLKRNNKRALKSRERKRKAREQRQAVVTEYEAEYVWPAEAWAVAELTMTTCDLIRDGERRTCNLTPDTSARRGAPLAIGDRVLIDESRSIVASRLPRRSVLVRMREDSTRRSPFSGEEHVLAANVDTAVVVASKADPPFHPRLIDRYLVMCQNGGIQPVVCLNKSDLPGPQPDLGMYTDLGIPTVSVSANTKDGIVRLAGLLREKWSVLVGHSGVGKSSLINTLVGKEILRVGAVGGRTGRGKHTTTTSSVHQLDPRTFLIDTPGIRSWGLWDIDRNSLREFFPEFTPLASHCRFRDCSHTVEPDCAVVEAVEAGLVSRARYESYRRLFAE